VRFTTTVPDKVYCSEPLVAAAWLGPAPPGAQVRRLDGDPTNDRVDNLAYGTAEEVKADHAARARREEAAGAPTHCPAGHRFSDSWQGNWGQRLCQTCATLRAKAFPSPSRDLAYVRAYDRAQRARSRVLAGLPPNPVDCIDCGTPLGVKSGPGPKPTRCASCARLAQLAAQRTYNRRRRRKTAAA